MKPTAAPHTWPYPGRTMAEVLRDEERDRLRWQLRRSVKEAVE